MSISVYPPTGLLIFHLNLFQSDRWLEATLLESLWCQWNGQMYFLFTGLLYHLKVVPIFIHEKTPSGRVASFRGLIDEFTSNVTFSKAFPPFVCVKMTYDCVCVFVMCCLFSPAQVHQLPPYRDEHFSRKPGSRPPGGAADAQPALGDVCAAGARAAWGSQPAAGQEIWPSPPPYTPHQVQ